MKWFRVFESEAAAKKQIALNRPQLVIIRNTRICLVQTPSGFYAIADACPHRGVSLSKGNVNYLGEVICPLHNYRYQLKDGKECELRTVDAKTFPIKIDEQGLHIGMPS